MATVALPGRPREQLLLGHLPELKRDWLGGLTRYAREYGDYVPLRFGPRRAALLSHPDYVEQVLVTRYRDVVKSPALSNSRRLLGGGLVTSEGELWRRQRRLLQPAFHRERIAAYGQVMVDYAQRLAHGWRDGEQRDLHAEMTRLTLEIVAKTLFDAEVSGAADEVGAVLNVVMARFNARMNSLLLLLPDTWPTPGNLGFLRAAARLDRIIYGIIAQRRASGEERGDLLSMLLRTRDEAGSRMSDRQLRDEVMTLFLAGHETTAVALSWAWYLLAQHPDVEARLLEELRTVLGGRPPTVEDVPRLRYAEMVVSEALRLYPPAWTVGRLALRDLEIGGHLVRRGTILLMSQWVIQRDPRYFDEPGVFRPERWADGLAKRLPKFAYFPFGGGPRQCIGNNFAMMEAMLVLATIAQRFCFRLLPGQEVVPWPSVTLRPKEGVRAVVRRRNGDPDIAPTPAGKPER